MNRLTIAIGSYGLTRALKDGAVKPASLGLDYVEIEPVTKAMRRMVRGMEFDVCEMAFTTYLCAKALGAEFTAIPVFLTRNFHHWAAFCNVKSGIRAPKDLEGRRVAVNRGYTVTTGLWVRGILQSEYGVDLDKITWVPTDEEHVATYKSPANVDLSRRGEQAADLLLSGDCDAAIGDVKTDSPDIKPLIPDARAAGFAYFRKTGIYPLNHGLVVKDAILRERPEMALELFAAFTASKAAYLARLDVGPAPADETVRGLRAVVGDPFPFGLAANRKPLAAIVDFSVAQKVISRKLAPEQLFAANTLTLE
jgi:4,5-dihydroxyphthalate decarboxylase